jgi:hypothetical protein
VVKRFIPSLSAATSLAVAVALICASVLPANAGRWVPGGTFDPRLNVATNFVRFLAEDGEGQMTIRCDTVNGLSVDAGVNGNGELPEGVGPGDDVDVTLTFVRGEQQESVTVAGPVFVRGDGAVMATITAPAVDPLGPLLLLPADRLDITIADVTLPVPLGDVNENLQNIADRCAAWPQ